VTPTATHDVEAVIQDAIALVPALADPDRTVAPLAGGLTNHNYRIDAGGRSFVLRIAGAGSDALGIDRDREVACLVAAAAAGVGPGVFAYHPQRHALFTAFVEGKQLQQGDLQNDDALARVAEVIRRYHRHLVPPEVWSFGSFDPFATIRRYRDLARARGEAPGQLDEAITTLGRIERETRSGDLPCLCHNDLLAANFIDSAGGIVIIDWEYASLGDRFFDLGNFAANNELSADQEQALLAHYCGEVQQGALRRLQLMRLVSDLREATWSFLQAADNSAVETPAFYRERGQQHLDRFQTAAASLLT
jgi:thiamine kinase-like enzyme